MTAVADTGCSSSTLLQITEAAAPGVKPSEASKEKCGVTRFQTACAFLKNGTCSKTIMTVVDREFDNSLRAEEKASDPLAGGMMQGYQCGMLWGSTLAAGAQAYRLFGPGPKAEAAALNTAMKLVGSFRDRHNTVDCVDITDTDPQDKWKVFINFFVKGGTIKCGRRIADFGPVAARTIKTALSRAGSENPCDSANCAAMLARKVGASEMHTVMAAGFAGGIGLSGSGCGALGAAIWLIGMYGHEQGLSNKAINGQISQMTEAFLKTSGYEFECSEIAKRKFEDAADHARHVYEGGCSNVIEVLAESIKQQSS